MPVPTTFRPCDPFEPHHAARLYPRPINALIAARVDAIRDYHRKPDGTYMRAELDVSGGIDSADVLMLLSKAIGPENITAVYQGIQSSQASLERAREVARAAGVRLIECDWSNTVYTIREAMINAMEAAGYDAEEILRRMDADPTIMGSLRSTFRAPMGRFANRLAGNGIRHGTGNEDEDRWLRFFQKGGDGEVDVNSLALFTKGEVFQMAVALGVPESILKARPTPDLWGDDEKSGGQCDEDEIKAYLGLTLLTGHTVYSYIDRFTGAYTHVGLIERVSRFLDYTVAWDDDHGCGPKIETAGDVLFGKDEPNPDLLLFHADKSGLFKGLTTGEVGVLLGAARRAEAATRHKENTALKTLGTRAELVKAGLLTNDLPL